MDLRLDDRLRSSKRGTLVDLILRHISLTLLHRTGLGMLMILLRRYTDLRLL